MSFSTPRNVPRFDDSQRAYENAYWANSGHSRQYGHTSDGIGSKIGEFFPNSNLPMYKDKPYNYAASRRSVPLWRRKRTIVGALIVFVCTTIFLAVFDMPLILGGIPRRHGNLWQWIQRSASSKVDWEFRRESVKEAFLLSWDSYMRNAWGMDEYLPLSKSGKQMSPTGLGWIIVDSLDTLMIMNLTSELSHARNWISTSLNYAQDQEVNTFETTIRMLGGLLSAHYLSTEFPNMAPIEEDDVGKPGEDLYLERAADLADRLLGAFETPSGIPFASVNLKTLEGIPSHNDGGSSSTAEAGSLQLEFKYLAMLMGEKAYWERAERVMKVIDDNGMKDGLLPIFISPESGHFMSSYIRLGSRGDSYYEYLIKQYLQTSNEEPIYLELWNQALAGVRKHLITYSSHSHLTVLGERPNGLEHPMTPKMDHLVCFMPGAIALGATEGRTLTEARKSNGWGTKQESEMTLARELLKTCWGMYKATATGLAPEITFFTVDNPPHTELDGKLVSKKIDFADDSEEGSAWRQDYIIKPQDSHNLQRPETVESLFYLWRITGDTIYREWGWEMFKSFIHHTAVENGNGFTSLANTNMIPPEQMDNMESFWLAETLKYFYLLFSPVDLLPLDQIVINTEAHILPRFKLQRGLKTGWTRAPRDSDGNLIHKETKGSQVSNQQQQSTEHERGPAPQPVHTLKVIDSEDQNRIQEIVGEAGSGSMEKSDHDHGSNV